MARVLVLFDVDGTLLLTGGASSRCIERAAVRVLGERLKWGPVTVGTTDPQIFQELAQRCGIEQAADHLEQYRETYLAELEAELNRVRAEVKVLPGVRERLAELSQRADVMVGLLTGNYRRAVELKLAAAGLDAASFALGAFAEDGPDRPALVAAARRAHAMLTGQAIAAGRIILVGDTPRDIACAHATGCRVLAVATGHYSLPQLAAQHPDAAVATLEDRAALDRLIAAAGS